MFKAIDQSVAGFARIQPLSVRMDNGVKLGFEQALNNMPPEVLIQILVARAAADPDVHSDLCQIADMAESKVEYIAHTWFPNHLAVVLAAAKIVRGTPAPTTAPTGAATQPAQRTGRPQRTRR